MGKHLLLAFCCCLLAVGAAAQDFKVERDTAGRFLLLSAGQRVAFDTAEVRRNWLRKASDEAALRQELELLERLLAVRRQWAVVRDERDALAEILKQSQQCATH